MTAFQSERGRRISETKRARAAARRAALGIITPASVVPPKSDIPLGLCGCGCGRETKRARFSNATRGEIKGQPRRFVRGHYTKPDRHAMYVIDETTGCWNWTGHLTKDGYSRFGEIPAHALFYADKHGPIPEGMQHDHLCRNRRCVNPDHLEAVTPRENTLRGRSGRLHPSNIRRAS